jgi:hypothetical protein
MRLEFPWQKFRQIRSNLLVQQHQILQHPTRIHHHFRTQKNPDWAFAKQGALANRRHCQCRYLR